MGLDNTLHVIGITLYYLCFPIIFIFRVLWTASIFISAPVVHTTHYLLHALAYPFHILGKLETFYIYFGVAVLVGISMGAGVHYAFILIVGKLGIDKTAEERGRTLASYRAEKAEKRAKQVRQSLPRVGFKPMRLNVAPKDEYSDWLKQDRGPGRTKGLLSTTILEEEDSSEAGF